MLLHDTMGSRALGGLSDNDGHHALQAVPQ